MAEESKSWALAKWLRAQGCSSGDGTFAEFHLAKWKDKGWEGNTFGSRTWPTAWGSGSDWWSRGYEPKDEPKDEPASSSKAPEPTAGEWPSQGKGGGKGSGGGGSTGSGPAPTTAKWSSKGRGCGSGGGNKIIGQGSSKGSSGH